MIHFEKTHKNPIKSMVYKPKKVKNTQFPTRIMANILRTLQLSSPVNLKKFKMCIEIEKKMQQKKGKKNNDIQSWTTPKCLIALKYDETFKAALKNYLFNEAKRNKIKSIIEKNRIDSVIDLMFEQYLSELPRKSGDLIIHIPSDDNIESFVKRYISCTPDQPIVISG